MRTIRDGKGKEHFFPYDRDASCRHCGAAFRLEVGDPFDRRDHPEFGRAVAFPCPNCEREVALYEHGPVGWDGLTPRQLEVARILLAGCDSKTVAAQLYLSPQTIKNHISAIYRKLRVGSRAQFLLAALDAEATTEVPD
jgi:DNA-binding CsgD family transcriptional regulator